MTDYSEAEFISIEQIFPYVLFPIFVTFIENRPGNDGLKTTNMAFLHQLQLQMKIC